MVDAWKLHPTSSSVHLAAFSWMLSCSKTISLDVNQYQPFWIACHGFLRVSQTSLSIYCSLLGIKMNPCLSLKTVAMILLQKANANFFCWKVTMDGSTQETNIIFDSQSQYGVAYCHHLCHKCSRKFKMADIHYFFSTSDASETPNESQLHATTNMTTLEASPLSSSKVKRQFCLMCLQFSLWAFQ